MSQKSFEAAIADLERADGPPETVLEAAAKTLRLNLEETIERSSLEVRFRSTPQSYGFKEQWLLRWLLKKLGSASTTQAKNDGQDIERYAVSPQFWSLLLDLTTSIPSSVCLEILLERKFFPILVQLIQAFRNARQLPSTVEPRITAPADETPRPRKKRRLSPPEVTAPSAGSQHEKLLWVLLQAVCRCLDLFSPRSSQNNRQSSQPLLASNLSWDEQASIMGAVLETAVNLLDHAAGPRNQGVLSEVLTVVLCFWHGDSLANQAQKEGPDRAFSSYCLMPSLAILEHLRRLDSADRSMATQQKALERLVALHVIFPTRSSFNKQFARKWADIRDVPPYPQLEATLNDLQKRMFPDERPNKPPVVASKVPKWIILDIAARLVPSSDFRRRQAEQPWIDALFIYLAHTIWPQMSQASTDVRKPFKGSQESQQTWAASLEKLLDVILAEKLRVGLPLLGYLLKAVLALEDETIPWRLLVRILQVDIGILVPTSSLSTSEEFVRQLIEKLRVPLVPKSTYDNIRDDIILPLLRGFAQSRNLPSFLTLWQQNLAVAVRTPHLPQGGTEDVTLKLVWEDQAVFDQFKAIAQTNAPPSLGQKLLGDLIEPLTELAEATGSRAGVFAQLAIFSALLETTDTPIETWKLDSGQLMAVLDTIAIALPQVSESHGRRWRLWKVARQLVCCLGVDKISQIPKTMLDSQTRFMSLTDLATLPGHPNPSKILECLECFSFLLELVAQSADFEQHFGREMESLANLLQLCCANTGAELNVCVGPHFQCDSPKSLLAACIGSLLEKHKVFSKYPDSSKRLVEMALHIMAAPGREAGDDGDIPNIKALLRAVLTAEEVMNTSLLRQCIVHYILDNSKPGVATKIDQAILRHYLSKGVIQRSQLKSLANTTMERVFDVKASKALDDVVEDLALLNLLDVNATGSVIKSEDWLTWVNFSKDITDYKQFGQSPASLSAVEMLEHILKRVWERAVTASRNQVLSDIISWCGTCIEGSLNTKQSPPFLIAVPIFLEKAALLSRATPSTTISKKDLQKMTTSYTSTISRRLESSLCGKTDFSTLLNLRLLLNSARQTQASEVDEALSKNAFEFAQRLHAEQLSLEHSKATAAVHFLRASVEKRCWELSTPLNRMPSDVMRQVLASITRDVATHTNEQLNLLSIEADTLANHMAPTEWADVLGRLRQHSKEGSAGEFRQLFISSVILRIKDHHLQHDPRLTDELANIASLNTSGQYTPTELFLALENCRMVLQSHPLTVNQATLDRLLACLCLVDVSPHHYESSYPQNSQEQYGPQPADIYEELCMFLGVILGRHRRRISDRYHLLLPVMQRLLRCLFWPGTHALQDRQRSAAANDLNAYGRSLPQWIRGAEQPLPPSSAEKFSRLASSICNPTVSAARSSRKHGHNQLNDETKRARLLAGQHMQYLVMEYARCTLDGQITPTVKDKLMPGMYSVLDSMGRDLLRAANAGMDPSSRAIFKGLYDDFTRFGRWDKS